MKNDKQRKNKKINIISLIVISISLIIILGIFVGNLGKTEKENGPASKNEITSMMAVISKKSIEQQKNLKKVDIDLKTLVSTKVDSENNHWLLGGDFSEPGLNQKHGFALDVYFDRDISQKENMNSDFKYRVGTATID
ncbi:MULTISPECIES: hypothetical protein [Lactococcus]|uniref:hypothetical protein n=1 Tax=Lactococcus TaxID=1357 RepID=UPI00254CF304|nr:MULTISPECIES: hypothetical protein [Lactococcus]